MADSSPSTLTRSLPSDESPSLADEGAYMLPPDSIHPAIIAERLLLLDEFEHLREGEARIDWLLKRDEKVKGGRLVLGTAHMPKVQGDLNPCFVWMLERLFGRKSDFLIILDKAYWTGATPQLREILIFHELSHCIHKTDRYGDPLYDEEERPVFGLKSHDVEEFVSVVARYGAWTEEIRQFVDAVNLHG